MTEKDKNNLNLKNNNIETFNENKSQNENNLETGLKMNQSNKEQSSKKSKDDAQGSKKKKKGKKNTESDSEDSQKKKKKKKKKDEGEDNTKTEKSKKDKGNGLVIALDFANLRQEEFLKAIEKENIEREDKLKLFEAIEKKYTHEEELDIDDIIENYEVALNELKLNLQERIHQRKKKVDVLTVEDQMSLLSNRDWLKFKILDYEQNITILNLKLEPLITLHKSMVTAIKSIDNAKADKMQLRKYREGLRKLKEDMYEADKVINEMQVMAHALLPKNVAAHCQKVDSTRKRLMELQDEYLEKIHFSKREIEVNKNEAEALAEAIKGETQVAQILEKQKEALAEEKQELEADIVKYDETIEQCNQELDLVNCTMEEAQAMALQLDEMKLDQEKKLLVEAQTLEEETQQAEEIRQQQTEEWKIKKKQLQKKMKTTHKEIAKVKKLLDAAKVEYEHDQDMYKLIELFEAAQRERRELLDKLQSERILRKQYYNLIEDMKGAIRVFARVRPISDTEQKRGDKLCLEFPDIYSVVVLHPEKRDVKERKKEYLFDHVFSMSSTQAEIFKDIHRLIDTVFNGYNVCIFAYGQTGSGKTFTLIGDITDKTMMGIVPRSFNAFFDIINAAKDKYKTTCNFYMLELYNDKLLDLMKTGAEYSEKLDIHKNEHGMVVVPGCTMLSAASSKDMFTFFNQANENRHIAETKMNAASSRSHLILTVMFKFEYVKEKRTTFGKISIVDLAGSERLVKSGVTGINAIEAVSINKALTSLGDVISALTSANQGFVPYRNNKLTQLMQDSLGGTAKTLMIVNLSPVEYNVSETTGSLNYATRVKTIVNEGLKAADDDELQRITICLEKLRKHQECAPPL